MSKYNKAHLKAMATTVLQARENNDLRYSSLIVTMMVATGLPERTIVSKLRMLASAEL